MIFPNHKMPQFIQVSLDNEKQVYFQRPWTIYLVNVVKVKHNGSDIHLYWLEDQSFGKIRLTEITKTDHETRWLTGLS